MSFKTRLIDYLQRFIGDLVTRSSQIAELLVDLKSSEYPLLRIAAERDARDAAPGDADTSSEAIDARLVSRLERRLFIPPPPRARRGARRSAYRSFLPDPAIEVCRPPRAQVA
jgi:hypothetical protein